MEQVLRINNTDQRITYDSGWKIISNSGVGQNETYSLATAPAQFFFLFRGTGISFYGRSGGGGGKVQFRLDDDNSDVSLNGTNLADGPTRLWSADNLGDGDHQLFVNINSLKQNGTVVVDYFEVENSSGQGFDLQWAGPNATNVPEEAIIVDSSSPDIVFSNASQWGSANDVQYYRRSLLFTTQAGASLNFSFNGVAIWYYSDLDKPHGLYTVSIDGSDPEQLNGKNNGGQLTQRMLWSKTNLSPGRHTFTLRQYDLGGKYISLDFFRASARPSTTPTGTNAIAPESKPNMVALAIGLTFGLITLAIAVFGAFRLRRRRRRKSVDLLGSNYTPRYRPPTQVEQRSRWPQESKRPSQPTQALTLESTLSPGVSTPAAVSTSSIGITELEMPPSYDSHAKTGGAAMAG